VVGESACIAAREHGREELDANRQSDDQIAEAQFVVDEQRYHRQRQADGEITAEKRRYDARRRTRKVSRRGLRPSHTLCNHC
jgi:hypothetical protein